MTDPHGPDPAGPGQTKCAECDRGNAAYPYDGDTSRMMHDIRAGDRTISCVPCRNGPTPAPAARAAEEESDARPDAQFVWESIREVAADAYRDGENGEVAGGPVQYDVAESMIARFTSLRAQLAAMEQERDAALSLMQDQGERVLSLSAQLHAAKADIAAATQSRDQVRRETVEACAKAVSQVYGPWSIEWSPDDNLRAWRQSAAAMIRALLLPPPADGGGAKDG